jgi:hypothetical protein
MNLKISAWSCLPKFRWQYCSQLIIIIIIIIIIIVGSTALGGPWPPLEVS